MPLLNVRMSESCCRGGSSVLFWVSLGSRAGWTNLEEAEVCCGCVLVTCRVARCHDWISVRRNPRWFFYMFSPFILRSVLWRRHTWQHFDTCCSGGLFSFRTSRDVHDAYWYFNRYSAFNDSVIILILIAPAWFEIAWFRCTGERSNCGSRSEEEEIYDVPRHDVAGVVCTTYLRSDVSTWWSRSCTSCRLCPGISAY